MVLVVEVNAYADIYASCTVTTMTGSVFGRNLRKLRKRAGMKQADLARAIGVSQGLISQWENGNGQPNKPTAARLDELLNGENTLVQHSDRGVEIDDGITLPPSVTAEPVTDDSIEEIHRSIARLVELDGQYGGRDILPLACRLFSQAERRLANCPSRLEADFAAAAAELGEVAGWLAFDAVENDLARNLDVRALKLAERAKDAQMQMFIWGNLALLEDESGRPKASLRTVQKMSAAHGLSPRMRAMALMRHSRAAASLGDTRAVEMIRRAQSELQEGVLRTDPQWSWWINEPEMFIHEAGVHRALGNLSQAIEYAWAGREAVPPEYRWGRLLWSAHLTYNLAAVGDWSEAQRVAGEAVRLSGQVYSARGSLQLKLAANAVAEHGGPEELKVSLARASVATAGA